MKPMARYQYVVIIINIITEEWLQQQETRLGGGDGDTLRESKGMEKLPEKQKRRVGCALIQELINNK